MNSRVALVIAALVPIALCALLSQFRGAVDTTHAALALVLVVVGVSASGQRVAGAVAALVGTAAFDYFLVQPLFSFHIAGRSDIATAVLLVLIGLAVTEIALWGRRQQAGASRREGYLSGVVSAARLAAEGESPAGLVEFVGRQIADVLDLDSCRFEYDVTAGPMGRPVLGADGEINWRGRPVDVRREGLPAYDEIELPVRSGGAVLGHYLLISASAVRRPDLERRQVAVTLAEQVGAALAARHASS
jgi:hypothetical protein